MHVGHARTFWIAQRRARAHGGTLVLRNEDLDPQRSRPEFTAAMLEDLRWLGLAWDEGPDVGGPFAPYSQSARTTHYRAALDQLIAGGFVFPCKCSRQDMLRALAAPHEGEEEPIYPGTCRPPTRFESRVPGSGFGESIVDVEREDGPNSKLETPNPKPQRMNWRFRVPDGEVIRFEDGALGPQAFVAGKDFGDFVVWRHDDVPSYQLAVVVDDAAMRITEVVRGEDLLLSTARQVLLHRALGSEPPAFFHCPLVRDEKGQRLAKRHDALSLRSLRDSGLSPEEVRAIRLRLDRGW
jgi:glutamyl-tRNA synthetase